MYILLIDTSCCFTLELGSGPASYICAFNSYMHACNVLLIQFYWQCMLVVHFQKCCTWASEQVWHSGPAAARPMFKIVITH